MIKRLGAMLLAGAGLLPALPAAAGSMDAPFTRTLSNTAPLVFGMSEVQAAQALGAPLQRLRGRRGDETMLVLRDIGGSGLWPRHDRLYLQFRRGRLTGWKGDWGGPWMWR